MAKGDVLVRMKADTQNYDANLAKARRQLNAFVQDNMTASGALRQLQGSLLATAARFASVTAAVGALGMAFRYNIETAKNFQSSMSGLSALTGKTGEDLNKLKEYAIELGSSTTLTASEVADAFRLIGSQQPQLLESSEALKEVTKYAITLSEAAGIDLATASQTLSASINQMGGDSENAARYVNVLAAASQKGAGDIAWLGESITKAATAAKAVGTDYEELVANLEMLAKAGFDASTAGTALRSIIMNLEKQANDDFKPSVVGLTQAFENLGKAHLSIVEYQKIAGKMFASQAMALANMSSEAKSLTEAITGTSIAEEQATTNTDNFAGAIRQLKSAWEGFNLQLNDSNGLLTTFVKKTTEALRSFSNYAFKNPTSLWNREDNIENPNSSINKKPQKKTQSSGVKGSYVVVTDASEKTISATHYDGPPPVEDTNTPASTKTTKTPKTPKNTWSYIDMQSYDYIPIGRSKADIQKDIAYWQKADQNAVDVAGSIEAQAKVKKYQDELAARNKMENPFAEAYKYDFSKDIEKLSKDLTKEDKTAKEAYAENLKNTSAMVGGIQQLVSGVEMLGVELPEGFDKMFGGLQGIITILEAIQTIQTVGAAMGIFHNGGIVPHAADGYYVPGNHYSGDVTPILANAGELILNKAAQGNLAATLQGAGGGGYQGTPYVEGEKIFLGMNNFLRRSGRGEIVTSRR